MSITEFKKNALIPKKIHKRWKESQWASSNTNYFKNALFQERFWFCL